MNKSWLPLSPGSTSCSSLHHNNPPIFAADVPCKYILGHFASYFIHSQLSCRISEKWNTGSAQLLAGKSAYMLNSRLRWALSNWDFLHYIHIAYMKVLVKVEARWLQCCIAVASWRSQFDQSQELPRGGWACKCLLPKHKQFYTYNIPFERSLQAGSKRTQNQSTWKMVMYYSPITRTLLLKYKFIPL